MIITGKIQKLQLMWTNEHDPDKLFIQIMFEQSRSENMFILRGYKMLHDVKVKLIIINIKSDFEIKKYTESIRTNAKIKLNINAITVRPAYNSAIPILKASFSK